MVVETTIMTLYDSFINFIHGLYFTVQYKLTFVKVEMKCTQKCSMCVALLLLTFVALLARMWSVYVECICMCMSMCMSVCACA